MRKISTTLLLFVCIAMASKAQYFNYLKANAVNVGNLTYTDLGTNGTAITTNFQGQPIDFDDDNSSVQNIGFTFSFAGVNFTQFTLNTNGFIKLGTDTTSTIAYDILNSTSASATNVIYGLNTDLKSPGNTEYRVFTSGTAGSRVCTIQFKGVMDNGYALASPVTPIQFDNIDFQIKLYEASNEVEFVYGNFTPSFNTAGFVATNCGLKSLDPERSVNATKSSNTDFILATFVEGPYPGNSFNIRKDKLPSPGFTLRFAPAPILSNNASVLNVYTQGKIPKNLDQTITASVQNIGATNKTNFPVTLTITGANPTVEVKNIANFPSGSKQTITFSTLSPANIGSQDVIVSIPSDDDNDNNADTITQQVTTSTIGYGYGNINTGVLGQTGNTIDFAVRFNNPGANSITSVTTYIDTVGRGYRVQIYGVSADTPKTIIANLGNKVSVAGANIITPTTPINVTGDFYVVVTQTSNAASLKYRYQREDPIRDKVFFYRTPSANTSKWNDFAPINPFRLMMDVTMTNSYLPIKLSSFTAFKEGNTNTLKWTTESEINNQGFEVQRSDDSKDFSKIGFVESKAINGNNSTTLVYNFVDLKPISGINYYRLKQFDKDGKISYSDIVKVSNTNVNTEIVSIYPNPTKENITVELNNVSKDKISIQVTDLLGKTALQQVFQPTTGINKIQLPTSSLAAGTYLVKLINSSSEELATSKFIKL